MPDADTPELPAWAPTVERIAGLLERHTRDSQSTMGEGGVLVDRPRLGTFSASTSPTITAVNEAIEQACDTMAGRLAGHAPCNAGLTRGVRGATAYLAAALAEGSRDVPDDDGVSALTRLWEQESVVAERVRQFCPFVPDPEDPTEPGASGGPVAVLPCDPGRITWETRW